MTSPQFPLISALPGLAAFGRSAGRDNTMKFVGPTLTPRRMVVCMAAFVLPITLALTLALTLAIALAQILATGPTRALRLVTAGQRLAAPEPMVGR